MEDRPPRWRYRRRHNAGRQESRYDTGIRGKKGRGRWTNWKGDDCASSHHHPRSGEDEFAEAPGYT